MERLRRRLPELVTATRVPVAEQVVVVRARGLAGLPGHVLPAAALGVAEVGEQAVGGRPAAGVVARVRDEADLADGLLAAAGSHAARQQAVEELRDLCVALAQRMREVQPVDATPGPAGRVGAG